MLSGILTTRLADVSSSSTSNNIDFNNELAGIAKLLHDYGSEIVITAVFILVFFIFCVVILKMMTKMLSELMEKNKIDSALTQDIMKKVLDSYFQNKTQEEEKDNKAKEDHKKATLVTNSSYATMAMKDASRIVMGELHCDRIGVYVFHNGNHSQFGFPFVKMTCISEFNMRGLDTTLRGLNHNGLPLHAFSNIVDCLVHNGEFIVGNIYDNGIISADDQVLNFVSGSPIKAIFALSITDDNGSIAAFTIAEFREAQDFSDIHTYEATKKALKTMNDTIKPIVINEDLKKEIIDNKGNH